MSNDTKKSDMVWLSLAFYVAYFTYFMSYAYEINYMITYKYAYLLFFSALICSFVAILFTSTVFEILTLLLIFTKIVLESYVFLVFLTILRRPSSDFLRWFYFLRMIVTILYLVLFWQYMNSLKIEKERKLEELRQIEEHVQEYNEKIQVNERNRNSKPLVTIQLPQNNEISPQVYPDPNNQMNTTSGHYYQVATPFNAPLNNSNMVYNPNAMYNHNIMHNNTNMMNTQSIPVPLPIPTTTATMTLNTNQQQHHQQQQQNNNGVRYPYVYVDNNNNKEPRNIYSDNSHNH